MSKIINLKSVRKSRTRAEKRHAADVNTAKHGRTKADRKLTDATNDKANRHLDGHKMDPDT